MRKTAAIPRAAHSALGKGLYGENILSADTLHTPHRGGLRRTGRPTSSPRTPHVGRDTSNRWRTPLHRRIPHAGRRDGNLTRSLLASATLRMREGGLPWKAREPNRPVAGKGVPWGFMEFRRFRRLLKNASVMARTKQSHLEKTLPFQHAVQKHRSNLLTGPLEEGPLPRSFFPILAETRYSLAECEKTGGTRARYTGHRTKNPKRESHPEIYGGVPCPR